MDRINRKEYLQDIEEYLREGDFSDYDIIDQFKEMITYLHEDNEAMVGELIEPINKVEDIKKYRRKLLTKSHPDKFVNNREDIQLEAQEKFQDIARNIDNMQAIFEEIAKIEENKEEYGDYDSQDTADGISIYDSLPDATLSSDESSRSDEAEPGTSSSGEESISYGNAYDPEEVERKKMKFLEYMAKKSIPGKSPYNPFVLSSPPLPPSFGNKSNPRKSNTRKILPRFLSAFPTSRRRGRGAVPTKTVSVGGKCKKNRKSKKNRKYKKNNILKKRTKSKRKNINKK